MPYDLQVCKCFPWAIILQQTDPAVQQVLALHTLLESCEFKQFWTALRENTEVVELISGMEEAARSCESSGLPLNSWPFLYSTLPLLYPAITMDHLPQPCAVFQSCDFTAQHAPTGYFSKSCDHTSQPHDFYLKSCVHPSNSWEFILVLLPVHRYLQYSERELPDGSTGPPEGISRINWR